MWNLIQAIPGKRWAAYASLLAAGTLSPIRVGMVSGDSMAPTFHNRQPYLYTRYSLDAPRRGDVVLFKHGSQTFIKRVLAGPGEAVYVVRYSEGSDEVVPYWRLSKLQQLTKGRLYKYLRVVKVPVPEGKLYVVGDHVDASTDSRDFGLVPVSDVRGKVLQAPPPPEEWMSLATAAYQLPS